MVMREATLEAVRFPDPFRPAEGGRGTTRVLHLVDDPVVDRIPKGDATLGWSGDNRLALYLDVPAGMWELWRYEHDGVLRKVIGFPVDRYTAAEIVPAAILWLVGADHRLGVDPHLVVVEHNDRVARERKARSDAFVREAAERVEHGLRKDGVL